MEWPVCFIPRHWKVCLKFDAIEIRGERLKITQTGTGTKLATKIGEKMWDNPTDHLFQIRLMKIHGRNQCGFKFYQLVSHSILSISNVAQIDQGCGLAELFHIFFKVLFVVETYLETL